jgi:hypothetical protein
MIPPELSGRAPDELKRIEFGLPKLGLAEKIEKLCHDNA